MVRPTTLRSAANRVVHNACDNITRSPAAPGASSPGANSRPTTGATPRALKNPALTSAPFTRCGESPPVRVKLAP